MNEINAFHQMLFSGNKSCDDNTDTDAVTAIDNVDGQYDPYVSAIICRWYKKYFKMLSFENFTQLRVKTDP